MARCKLIVGRRIQSVTLVADARHSWLDALSSLGALVGLLLVATGHAWGDPVAGFAVTVFILHMGYEVTKDVPHHLLDRVDEADIVAARAAALAVPGVLQAAVRGRWMGRSLLLEVEIGVGRATTVERATDLGRQVETAVRTAVAAVRRVQLIPRVA